MTHFVQYPFQMFGNLQRKNDDQSNLKCQKSESPSITQFIPQFYPQSNSYLNNPIGSNLNNYSSNNQTKFNNSEEINSNEEIYSDEEYADYYSDYENEYDSDYYSDEENDSIIEDGLKKENKFNIRNIPNLNKKDEKVNKGIEMNLSEREKNVLTHSLANILAKYLEKVEKLVNKAKKENSLKKENIPKDENKNHINPPFNNFGFKPPMGFCNTNINEHQNNFEQNKFQQSKISNDFDRKLDNHIDFAVKSYFLDEALDKSIDLAIESYFRDEAIKNSKIEQAVESYLNSEKQKEQSKFNNQINSTIEKPFENKTENENKEFVKQEEQYNKSDEKSKEDVKPDIIIEPNKQKEEKEEPIIEEEEEDKSDDSKEDKKSNERIDLNKSKEEIVMEPTISIPIEINRNISYDNINESIERGVPDNPLEKEIEQQLEDEATLKKDDYSYYLSQLCKKESIQISTEIESEENEDGEEKNIEMNLTEHKEKTEDLFHVASPEEKIEIVNYVEEEKNNLPNNIICENDDPSLLKQNENEAKKENSEENETKKENNEENETKKENNEENETKKENNEEDEAKKENSEENEKSNVIERSLKIEIEPPNTKENFENSKKSSSQEIDQVQPDKITDEIQSNSNQNSPTDSESSTVSQNKERKLIFAPREPVENEKDDKISLKKRFSSSPRRNRNSSQEDLFSLIHEPESNTRHSPRINRSHSSLSNTNISISNSSSSLNLDEAIANSAPPESPKRCANIIAPNPDEVTQIPSSRKDQNINVMGSKSIKYSNSTSKSFTQNSISRKQKTSNSMSQLPPELEKLMRKARLREPLNNVTVDQFKKLLLALNDERKMLAKEHKFKEGLICNSTISHVNKYYEAVSKLSKIKKNQSEENLDSNGTKLVELKKKLNFLLVQSRFKEAEEIQKQIDVIKSSSESSKNSDESI